MSNPQRTRGGRTRFALVMAVTGLTTPVFAQTIVTGGGAAIQVAIDNASPGAVLVVQPGSYDPIVIDQSITIEFQPGSVVVGAMFAALVIQDIGAAESVRIRGGAFRRVTGTNAAIIIDSIAGSVALEDVSEIRTSPASEFGSSMEVRNSELGHIRFDRIDQGLPIQPTSHILVDGCGDVSFNGCPNLPALLFENSTVAMIDSTVPERILSSSPAQLSAMRTIDSTVEISGGVFFPLRLASSSIFFNRTLEVSGTGSVRATNGARFERPGVTFAGPLGTPTVVGDASQVLFDDSVVIIDPIDQPSFVTQTPIPFIEVANPSPGSLGITLGAESDAAIVGLVGLPETPLPLPIGSLWIADPVSFFSTTIPTGATGVTTGINVPPSLPPDLELTFQALTFTSNQELRLSPPDRVVLP